ncbi:hypothetical protein KC360_g412 [Hortaea werneckii]|nr:hypothetical protein KC325_g1737 [Hortaea werneckii]KAI6998800.1 hypothetical protein KC359_g2117 [Hortaea werneckii]KAI7149404.1 hypothetical protein KC344_g1091 [Hortaea werneckii]KAI7180037.1 hypothetical protein KC360_g412 [Hortaea werneckii]
MKTDNYLTQCLEQAAKSPLHYRHGCIIVRGGKIIGQGFNDYRPGFDGGALKHGRIAKSALDGPAIAGLKEKLKKQKGKEKHRQQRCTSTKTFTPFEARGGGQQSNTPLTMHSEMMAIHSALAASSTLSSTAFACEKPCFKLPSGDKRKARLRAEVLKRYVNAVCETAASAASAGSGKTQVQECDQLARSEFHNNNNPLDDRHNNNNEEDHAERPRAQQVLKECRRAFHVPESGEKHHHHQKRKEKYQKKDNQNGKNKYQDQYEYELSQSGRHGQQTQQHRRQQQSAASKRQCDPGNDDLREHDSTANDVTTTTSRETFDSAKAYGKRNKDYKRSGKMRSNSADEHPQPEPTLLPKGHTGPSLNDRKKHPRLMGADLYVTRLGWCKGPAQTPRLPKPQVSSSAVTPPPTASDPDEKASNQTSTALSSAGDGSLYEELSNRTPSPTNAPATAATLDPNCVRASRPCYRCISYMHSVGIKRVFWTTDDGRWEGGKVRDLVAALDNSMENVAAGGDGGGPTGNGVFVTKHEVLMLKRLMGESSG